MLPPNLGASSPLGMKGNISLLFTLSVVEGR